jgi:hypothetical protein
MDSSQVAVSQIALGYAASAILERLKNASWFPWLKQEGTKTKNIIAAIIASGVAITGINYVYDPSAHTVLLTNVSFVMVAHAVWSWFTQFALQQGWYELRYNKAPTK